MFYLGPEDEFPPVDKADSQGLLAFSRELSADRVIAAYERGIFPWYEESQPVLWWSPDPRMVLFPERLQISKSMRRMLKDEVFTVSFNGDFEKVIMSCASIKRRGQRGTWITPEVKKVYTELHQRGIALSVEVFKEGQMVGGLYGIYLREQKVFSGESMFSTMSNSSKFGFIKLVSRLKQEGVKIIDCQVHTAHLESLGAEEISRQEFLSYLSN